MWVQEENINQWNGREEPATQSHLQENLVYDKSDVSNELKQ